MTRGKPQNRRPLDPEEVEASDRLKKRVTELRLGLNGVKKTQGEIADETGVSQGMIWQWANRRMPVPLERAEALATAVGLAPEEVSVEYARAMELASGRAGNHVKDGGNAVYELRLDTAQQEVLQIYESLTADGRKAWVEVGRAMARASLGQG